MAELGITVPFDIIKLLHLLKNARIVGGYVRNSILNHVSTSTDIDIATNLLPIETIQILKNNGIITIPTGIKHGTVTALYHGKNIEITTLRKESLCDGRHAEVNFTNSWKEDAQRRDFTINALYLSADGKIHDYFNGINDLLSGSVIFIGNPVQRILEDHLRILRCFRFTAMFMNYHHRTNIVLESFNISISMSYLLHKVSRERIAQEMMKLLLQPGAGIVLNQMRKGGALDYVYLPIFKISDDVLNSFYPLSSNYIINLAFLLRMNEWTEDEIMNLSKNWRMSKTDTKDLIFLVESPLNISIDHQKKFLYINGITRYKLYMEMHYLYYNHDNINDINILREMPVFPLMSSTLIKLGYKEKDLGNMLKKAKEYWLKENCLPTEKDILKECLCLYRIDIDNH